MPTRAVYSFSGFPNTPPRHHHLHHEGYPADAAWRFSETLRVCPDPTSFLVAFLSTHPEAEPIQSAERVAATEYRSRVQLVPDAVPHLQVQCWRRIPLGGSWIPRCRPMPLAVFIQHFLPGDPR